MVASPNRGNVDPTHSLQQQINDLKKQITNLANKTLYSANIGAGGLTFTAGGSIKDALGNAVVQPDPLGGLAYPWLSVAWYPLFQPILNAPSTGTWGPNAVAVSQIDAVPANANFWTAYIPRVISPQLAVRGAFGPTAGTHTQTINIYIADAANNETLLSSTNYSAYTDPVLLDGLDLTPWLGQTAMRLRLRTSVTGTNNSDPCALHMYGSWMQGSI